jgi:hypothetical protein
LLAAVLTLAACGDDGDSARPDGGSGGPPSNASELAAFVRAAPERAAEASTGRVELQMSMTLPDVGEVTLTGTGAFDRDAGRMHMRMDLSDMLTQVAAAAGEEVPPGLDEPMEVLLDGDTVYLRIPFLQQEGQPSWHAVPADAAGSTQIGGGGSDPAALLDSLRGVSDDVRQVGREDVGGVSTTRFAATVSTDAAIEEVPPEDRERLRSQFETFGISELPVEVWIDDDGLARRMELRLDELLSATGQASAADIAVEFHDYGEPVDIEPPDPADTRPPGGGVLGGGPEG